VAVLRLREAEWWRGEVHVFEIFRREGGGTGHPAAEASLTIEDLGISIIDCIIECAARILAALPFVSHWESKLIR
jgi:hypothetical protein